MTTRNLQYNLVNVNVDVFVTNNLCLPILTVECCETWIAASVAASGWSVIDYHHL